MARPKKEPVEDVPERGPDRKAFIKIGAVLAVIAIIIIIVIAVTSGGGPDSIAVGNVERGGDGISFSIMATRGTGDYTGDVDIEIYYEDMEDPIYESEAHIDNGDGNHEVDYVDFVWGNGDYYIYAKEAGEENYQIFRIESLVEKIVPEFDGGNSDADMMVPSFKMDVTIGYEFGFNRDVPRSEDPQFYRFVGNIISPDGSITAIDSADYPSNLLKITRSVDHTQAGTYTVTGTVTNEFCHPNSPFKVVEMDGDNTEKYDSNPFAVLGEDMTIELLGDSVDATFDGSMSWDDSSIVLYKWYVTGEGINFEDETEEPELTYSFRSTGSYVISLSVTDDSDQTSIQNAEVASLVVTVQ